MLFEQLPIAYQKEMLAIIKDWVGDEDGEITEAYKEWEASGLLGCEISENDKIDVDDLESELCAFRAGWFASRKQMTIGKQGSLIQ